MRRRTPKGPLAVLAIALFTYGLSLPADAKNGTNAFATPYVIQAGGTGGTISAPPGTTGTSTAVLTTIGGSLEAGETPVSVVDSTGSIQPVQGQTVWFSWTPAQSGQAIITVTSANTNPYQFQPAVAIYANPASLAAATVASGSYVVSPNGTDGAGPPKNGGYIAQLFPGIFQTVASLNATAGTRYMIQVDGVQTSSFPYVAQGNFTFSLAMIATSDTPPAPSYFPQSGWWYSPSIPAVGFAIEVNPPLALLSPGGFYLGAFLYDDSGNALWYVAQGQLALTSTAIAAQAANGSIPASPQISANSYYSLPASAGIPVYLQQYANGPTLTSQTGSGVQFLADGAALQLIFKSATTGTLVLNGTSISIQRYPIPNAVPFLPSTATAGTTTTTTSTTTKAVLANGWYWNASQGGTGVFFEQQANQVFIADFMYRDASAGGTAIWYVANGPLSSTSLFSALLYEYSGGASLDLLDVWPSETPPGVGSIINHGNLTLTLSSSTTSSGSSASTASSSVGSLSLGTRSIALTKFNF